MKTRTGFVSNSSSSSFLIFGTYFEQSTLVDLAIKLGAKYDDGEIVTEENAYDDPYVTVECLLEFSGLEFVSGPPESSSYVVGRDPQGIGDNETGAQFKQSVVDGLKKLFDDDVEPPSWQSEAWYDG